VPSTSNTAATAHHAAAATRHHGLGLGTSAAAASHQPGHEAASAAAAAHASVAGGHALADALLVALLVALLAFAGAEAHGCGWLWYGVCVLLRVDLGWMLKLSVRFDGVGLPFVVSMTALLVRLVKIVSKSFRTLIFYNCKLDGK